MLASPDVTTVKDSSLATMRADGNRTARHVQRFKHHEEDKEEEKD